MSYSEVQKEQAMKAMCEICEMGRCYDDGEFKCLNDIFPCCLIKLAFNKVIEILEDKNGKAKRD